MTRTARHIVASKATAILIAAMAAVSAPASVPPAVVSPAPSPGAEYQAEVDLARAVVLWRAGDLRGAADVLGGLDLSVDSKFTRADRAAFLLAVIERRLGRPQALRDKLATVADASSPSPYRRWLAHLNRWDAVRGDGAAVPSQAGAEIPGGAVLEAALLMDSGQDAAAADLLAAAEPAPSLRAIHLQLQASALTRAGRDADAAWRRLASLENVEGADADLVAGALMQLAGAALARGEDADAWLLRVPVDSFAAGESRRVLALTALARGDTATAVTRLEEALARPLLGASRRQALLERGALAGARGEWTSAADRAAEADADWRAEAASLDGLERADAGSVARAWAVWSSEVLWRDDLRLTPRPLEAAMAALAENALDLRRDPPADPREILTATATASAATVPARDPAARHRPAADQMDAWQRTRDRLSRAEAQRDARAWELDRYRDERDRRLAFLDRGRRRASVETDSLLAVIGRLEAMGPRLTSAIAALGALHDRLLADIAARTKALDEELRRNALYAQAVQHFHVDGPVDPRRPAPPAGEPLPGALLAQEIDLAERMQAWTGDFAARTPGVLTASLHEIWIPRLADGSRRLHDGLAAQSERAVVVASSLEALRTDVLNDPGLALREQRVADAAALASGQADSLRAAETSIARAVAAQGRRDLAREREGIDYHVADAAYWRAVALATDPATAERLDLVAPAREAAAACLDTFLSRYPQSDGLSETRFRLADLNLLQARDAFQERMAAFVGTDGDAGKAGRALAPFFDAGPASALYEAILADDPAFAHRDAVLFNLGMIKADAGQPGAMDLLQQLVNEYPGTPGAQEAWLRLGDDRFENRDYAGCLDFYEQAAAQADPALAAIALYKLGWAQFAEDAFAEAAVAFTRLLDLPASASTRTGLSGREAGAADLRTEAQDHLVHTLLRAGGAMAFEHHLAQVGPRPWDAQVLAEMAVQAGRYSLDEEAVACDELWLRRYPEQPGALAAAERMVATHEHAGRVAAARETRLAQAPRFLPDSTWIARTDSLQLRERADRFAREAYEGAAVFEHQTARAGRDSTAWSRALNYYETCLRYWPDVAEAPRLQYQAGEAASAVRHYAQALDHFEAAARSDTATFAADAAWQAVAVRDTWYRSARPADAHADSLAHALLTAGDAFMARYPDDTHAADLAWRQGQVAYAHGWDRDAARRLLAFTARYPGDARAAESARLAGDARYRRHDFAAAGEAYELALERAAATRQEKLAAQMTALLPLCAFEHAAATATADSAHDGAAAAPLFAAMAARWPSHEHASLALYRAGLAYAAGGQNEQAINAWTRILDADAKGPYGRDAALRIARTNEAAGQPLAAAVAWTRFADQYPADPDAATALLKAIDLRDGGADHEGAEALRDAYLKRFPEDLDTAFEVREARARRELETALANGAQVAALVDKPAQTSALRQYLDLAAAHPDHASAPLLAKVDYAVAEAALKTFTAMPLTQPLPPAIERKNRRLEEVVALFNRCADRGDPEYAHAAAHRVGEAIIHFGDALLASERPAGLAGDDLAAYDEVLREQSWTFTERGEDVWTQLLRQASQAGGDDPGGWLARTQTALWPRLARRYVHRPELEYPLAAVSAAAAGRP